MKQQWFKENQPILIMMGIGILLIFLAIHWTKSSQYSSQVSSEARPFDYELATNPNKSSLPQVAPRPHLEKKDLDNEFIYSLDYVQNTVKAYQKYFQKCYTLALQKDQTAKGTTTMKFEIAETGAVSKSQISLNTVQVAGFESCILEALSRIPFRAHPGEPIRAVLPLTFE